MIADSAPLYCCEKMYQILSLDNATFRMAKPNLISAYLGNGEEVDTAEHQAIMEKAKKARKKKNNPKKNQVQIWKIDMEKIDTHGFEDKVIKYQIREVINYCPFCGEKYITDEDNQ